VLDHMKYILLVCVWQRKVDCSFYILYIITVRLQTEKSRFFSSAA